MDKTTADNKLIYNQVHSRQKMLKVNKRKYKRKENGIHASYTHLYNRKKTKERDSKPCKDDTSLKNLLFIPYYIFFLKMSSV